MNDKKNFWVSWYNTVPLNQFELHSPWWVSGSRESDDADTVCAAVKAVDEGAARNVILHSYDTPPPGGVEWRFVEPRADDWSPFSGRFGRADWMVWP